MAGAMDRRRLLLGAGSLAVLSKLGLFPVHALDFGTVLGAAGVGLFPGAATAIGGFGLIRLIGDGDNLINPNLAGAFLPAGNLCYLMAPGDAGLRNWQLIPSPNAWNEPGKITSMPLLNAQSATISYTRMMATTLKSMVAFETLTDGWQLFDDAVKSKLVNGDRDLWPKMPMLSA